MTPEEPTDRPLDLRIVSSGASAEEIAAVTAVLHGALGEMADDLAAGGEAKISAWQRTQRGVRSPLVPGSGRWRDYSG